MKILWTVLSLGFSPYAGWLLFPYTYISSQGNIGYWLFECHRRTSTSVALQEINFMALKKLKAFISNACSNSRASWIDENYLKVIRDKIADLVP